MQHGWIRLKIISPCFLVLYLLINTNKFLTSGELPTIGPEDIKVRPIISCVGGPTDRIARFLNRILVQLLRYVPAHLSNTRMLLENLRSTQFNSTCIMKSFDVSALYTNVSNDSAMQAISEVLSVHYSHINTYCSSIDQIMALLNACLSCSMSGR